MESDIVVREISVTCSAQQAFEAFVEQTDAWWVPRFTSDDDQEASALVIGPHAGSQVVETGAEGDVVRGDVIAWEPGRYVEFTFGSPRSESSARHIKVTFKHTGDDASDVRFEQDGGEPCAWDDLIDRYARYADAKGVNAA